MIYFALFERIGKIEILTQAVRKIAIIAPLQPLLLKD
jgi:hypothetical protein